MAWGEDKNGFSMIELMITVLVLGLLSLVLVPFSIEAVGKSQLESAARMIASDIRYGEGKALTEQRSFKILFVPTNNEYKKYFDKDNRNKYVRVKMPGRIKLSGAVFGDEGPEIRFNLRGTVLSGGSVSLTDNHGNWMFVRVVPVTGRVRIESNSIK